jgi:hypothetical protein
MKTTDCILHNKTLFSLPFQLLSFGFFYGSPGNLLSLLGIAIVELLSSNPPKSKRLSDQRSPSEYETAARDSSMSEAISRTAAMSNIPYCGHEVTFYLNRVNESS